ncbi:MAG: DmsE family decaheme c-type cytochrome [Gammaproteobacteria bacterium]|nr:DmsE family decaheme c-type cytochrome [Gammaproteobacteria bacterium]
MWPIVALLAPLVTFVRSAEPDGYSTHGADTCLVCHNEARVLDIFRTPHAVRADPRTPFGHGQLQCEACHGPAGAHSARRAFGEVRPSPPFFGRQSSADTAAQNAACLDCHRAGIRHGWAGSEHERQGLTCAACHRIHTARDPARARSEQAGVCFACHRRQQAELRLPFAHPLADGGLGCSDCHDPHGATATASLRRTTVGATCTACHAEKRGPFLWEHPPVVEDCTHCHAAHGSTQPALLRQRAPLLCQRCHSEAGHPSLPASPRGLPGPTPSVYLLGSSCLNCHGQIHGSNHPSGQKLMR